MVSSAYNSMIKDFGSSILTALSFLLSVDELFSPLNTFFIFLAPFDNKSKAVCCLAVSPATKTDASPPLFATMSSKVCILGYTLSPNFLMLKASIYLRVLTKSVFSYFPSPFWCFLVTINTLAPLPCSPSKCLEKSIS